MFRDKGPTHNLGHGVSSRDMPSREGETETPSPNSGYVAKALDAHPMMRFFASAGTAMLVTTLASKFTKAGGLRLGKALQNSSDAAMSAGRTDALSTRAVRSITEIRKELDNLSAMHRSIDGVDDPYLKAVYEVDGKLTTGYNPTLGRRKFFRPLSQEGARSSARGLTSETAEAWTMRDDLQVRLVKAARRMPYELPALYVTQRAVTEKLFGQDQEKKRLNWYNPADVISDFVKQSTINIATMILPFEAVGAAGAAGRSSLTTLAGSMNDLKALSPVQRKAANAAIDIRSLLAEVGQDIGGMTNKVLKMSSQTSGAFAAGVSEAGNSQPEFVQALRAARHGSKQAVQDMVNADRSNRLKVMTVRAKGFFTGTTEDGIGILDVVPSFRGSGVGIAAGKNQFKALGVAHDVVSGKLTREQALGRLTQKFGYSTDDAFTTALSENASRLKLRGLNGTSADEVLTKAINAVQSQHSSKLTRLSQDFYRLGAGGPSTDRFKGSEFYQRSLQDEYKDQLARHLVNAKGVEQKAADGFVAQIKINQLPSRKEASEVTNRISLGRKKQFSGETDEFFDDILERFRGVKGGKDFKAAIGNGEALKESIEEVDKLFVSEEFRKSLHEKIASRWNQFRTGSMPEIASDVLKPAKQSYLDFIGPMSEGKQTFLQRKTAQTLGISLVQKDGRRVSQSVLESKLTGQGFDPTDFSYMRDFLLNQRKLSTGFLGQGGTNVLGLRPLLVDEGVERGLFKFMPEEQQASIRQLASTQATFDPVTGGLGSATQTMGRSAIGGVYQTRSGEILDFTKVTSMLTKAKDFIASDFRIPVVGFNPADLMGNRSLKDIRNSPVLQYVSSRSVQPFIPQSEARPDFFILNRTKGTKGVLRSFTADESGRLTTSKLPGFYRAAPSASTEIFSREARNAAGLTGERVDTLGGQNQRFGRFKRIFDVDPEQPNSLFRLASRYKNRQSDIRNPRVLSELLSSENNTISYNTLKGKRSLRLDGLSVVDEAGEQVYSQSQVLSAVESFRKRIFNFNINQRVMKELEEVAPDLFRSTSGARASQINTVQDVRSAVRTVGIEQGQTYAQLRSGGLDPRQLSKSFSRLQGYMDETNFDVDKARSEIFRYISQRNQMVRSLPTASTTVNATDDIFTQIEKVTRQLQAEGKIGIDAAVEARAYGVATLFNFSAFSTHQGKFSVTQNAKNALNEVIKRSNNSESVRKLFGEFTRGNTAMVNTSIRRPASRLLPSLNRKFGTAPYEINDLSVNVLGSGQQYTMLPTFGTAFARNPMAAVKSAIGIGTYKNPEAFSTGSIPTAHIFGRLNKYFGTFGLQLDQSQYGGPLDLYMRGMVGKRVLPITAAGATFMAVDRTIGGAVNEKDQRGERVYSPFFTTKLARAAVEAQSVGSGLVPGGMSYEEKKDQLLNGEVAVRQGRYWPLGTTPFKGGKVLYYRPSYYRKLAEGTGLTSDSYSSPAEKLAFGYDFSPLRPFDPYRFERENYYDRPYPVTGEYFTGPFGPATALGNLTVGKILKPQMMMHEQEVAAGLAAYVPAGQSGAYNAQGLIDSGRTSPVMGAGGAITSLNSSSGGYYGAGRQISGYNNAMSANAGAMATASRSTIGQIGQYNNQLSSAAASGPNRITSTATLPGGLTYGPPKVPGIIPPSVVPAGAPISTGSIPFQASELGYRLQETAGIYGFAFGSLREGLGFGSQDMSPQVSALQSASKGYGSTRAFWDLNLGGLGDVPMAGEGSIGNIEVSEIVRRFIPKERTDVNYVNPIRNTMGQQYPFLPGSDYFINFKTGDPFTRVQEGEIRLPGAGYERLNTLYGDETGRYGRVNQLDILADVAPYSKEFRSLNRTIKMGGLSPAEKIKVQEIRDQVEDTTTKYQFTPYKYKGTSAEDMGMQPTLHAMSRVGEYIAHRDTFFNSKFLNRRTATEDWERRNVYGATFPEWQRPYESYIQPMINKASQRDPITATLAMATAGSFFGRTAPAKTVSSLVFGTAGFLSSVKGNIHELVTGERQMPKKRVKELALEEYVDIVGYVKNTSLAQEAKARGDAAAAASFTSAAKRTMYGADIYGGSVENLSLAIPKRKREHFKAMINAPEDEREKILSTSGRLERRIYQAAWGMKVEEKPDLAEYFSRHELPDQSWEGWHPNTNLEHVKIKMGQHMGLEMSQMGYYPQQVREANLTNPSYPSFFENNSPENVGSQLRAMMSRMGVSGSVRENRNPYGSNSVNLSSAINIF
jgi:hypothetical protein